MHKKEQARGATIDARCAHVATTTVHAHSRGNIHCMPLPRVADLQSSDWWERRLIAFLEAQFQSSDYKHYRSKD